MAGCEAQAPLLSWPGCSLLDKRWALSGWLQLFGSLPRVFLEQHCRRDFAPELAQGENATSQKRKGPDGAMANKKPRGKPGAFA